MAGRGEEAISKGRDGSGGLSGGIGVVGFHPEGR